MQQTHIHQSSPQGQAPAAPSLACQRKALHPGGGWVILWARVQSFPCPGISLFHLPVSTRACARDSTGPGGQLRAGRGVSAAPLPPTALIPVALLRWETTSGFMIENCLWLPVFIFSVLQECPGALVPLSVHVKCGALAPAYVPLHLLSLKRTCQLAALPSVWRDPSGEPHDSFTTFKNLKQRSCLSFE